MIIKRPPPTRGICFAFWPRWTKDGWAWMEWLHYEWVDGWGWGSGGEYRYARYVPDARYDAGERRVFETPPDPKNYCAVFRSDGPTPCHYPMCKYRDTDGTERCGAIR